MESFLLDVLLTMIAAGGAAFLGASAAVSRHRKERAFDRRLEWHEEAAAAVLATLNALRDLDGRSSEEYEEALAELTRQIASASIYAPRPTVEALRECWDEFGEWGVQRMRSLDAGAPPEEIRYALSEESAALQGAHEIITTSGRHHLEG